MSNQQHTPEWFIDQYGHVYAMQEPIDGVSTSKCLVDGRHSAATFKEKRLIAAAPELLAAAQEMADLLENILRIGALKSNDLIIAESIRNVLPIHRTAIAKARGES